MKEISGYSERVIYRGSEEEGDEAWIKDVARDVSGMLKRSFLVRAGLTPHITYTPTSVNIKLGKLDHIFHIYRRRDEEDMAYVTYKTEHHYARGRRAIAEKIVELFISAKML